MDLCRDRRGAAPVIAAVILVIITALLSTLLWVYVQDMDFKEPAPKVNYDYEVNNTEVTLRHDGDAVIDVCRTELVVSEATTNGRTHVELDKYIRGNDSRGPAYLNGQVLSSCAEMQYGDTLRLDVGVQPETVRVVYMPESRSKGDAESYIVDTHKFAPTLQYGYNLSTSPAYVKYRRYGLTLNRKGWTGYVGPDSEPRTTAWSHSQIDSQGLFIYPNLYIAASQDTVYGVDVADGTIAFQQNADGLDPNTYPDYIGSGVFFFDKDDGELFARSNRNWTDRDAVTHVVRVRNQELVYGKNGNQVVRVTTTGDVNWTTTLPETINMTYPSAEPVGKTSSLPHNASSVYITSDTTLYELDTDDGSIIQNFSIGQHNGVTVTAVEDDKLAVIGNGDVKVFNKSDGSLVWETSNSQTAVGSPASRGGRLIVSYDGGRIAAYDSSNGNLIWDRSLQGSLTSPTIAKRTIYVWSENDPNSRVYALEVTDGDVVWVKDGLETPGPTPAQPTMSWNGTHMFVYGTAYEDA